MANRSKKAMLSARVEPYLKSGIELLAASKNLKMVKLLEEYIEHGLSDTMVERPGILGGDRKKISFTLLLTAIWTDDEVLFKLRAGSLGKQFAGEELYQIAFLILEMARPYFDGESSLYGNMNGYGEKYNLTPIYDYQVNMELIKEEWELILKYSEFLRNNKPFQPTYEEFKSILRKSSIS